MAIALVRSSCRHKIKVWQGMRMSGRGCQKASDVLVVVYHNFGERPSPLTKHLGITIRPEAFVNQIKYFQKHYDLVGVTDLLSGTLPGKPIIVTFDDAYRSVLNIAAPILKAANAPSVWFVSPIMVLGNKLVIDNVISAAVDELGWERVISKLQLEKLNIRSANELITCLLPALKPAALSDMKECLLSEMRVTEVELRRTSELFCCGADLNLGTGSLMELGNHSLSHAFFRGLSRAELEREIVESRTILQNLSRQGVSYLAVPYGRRLDATEAAIEVARASGHRAIFLVQGRLNRVGQVSDVFDRIDVGSSGPGSLPFVLRALPVLRSLKDSFYGR